MSQLGNYEMSHIVQDHIVYSWGLKDVLAKNSKYISHEEGVYLVDTDGNR